MKSAAPTPAVGEPAGAKWRVVRDPTPTRRTLRSESGSGAPSKCAAARELERELGERVGGSDRDREVVGEAARERIRPVEEAGKIDAGMGLGE